MSRKELSASPLARLISLTSILVILHITKTSSNNCLIKAIIPNMQKKKKYIVRVYRHTLIMVLQNVNNLGLQYNLCASLKPKLPSIPKNVSHSFAKTPKELKEIFIILTSL